MFLTMKEMSLSLFMQVNGESYEEVFEKLKEGGKCLTVEEYETKSVTSSSRFLVAGSVLEIYPPVGKITSKSGNSTEERQVILIKSIAPNKIGRRARVVLVGDIAAAFQRHEIKEKDVVCLMQPRITYPVPDIISLSVGPGMTVVWYWKPITGFNTLSLNGVPDPNEEPIVRHFPRPIRPSSPPPEFNETMSRVTLSRKGSVSSRQTEDVFLNELFFRLPSLVSCCLHHTNCEKNQSIVNLLQMIIMSKKRSEFRDHFQSHPDSPPDESRRKKRLLSCGSENPTDRPSESNNLTVSPRALSDEENCVALSESSSDLIEAKKRRKSASPVQTEQTLNNSNESDVLGLKSPPREVLPNGPRFKKQLYSPRPDDDFEDL